jgi:hypothetical protein
VKHSKTYLGGNLDSTTHTLGEGQVTLLGTSLDGVVKVVNIGSRRHVDLVLVGKVPGASATRPVARCSEMVNLLLERGSRDTGPGLLGVGLDTFLEQSVHDPTEEYMWVAENLPK